MPLPSNPHLTALRIADPEAAARLIVAALTTTQSRAEAAKKLGVSKRTLYRWLAENRKLLSDIELAGRQVQVQVKYAASGAPIVLWPARAVLAAEAFVESETEIEK